MTIHMLEVKDHHKQRVQTTLINGLFLQIHAGAQEICQEQAQEYPLFCLVQAVVVISKLTTNINQRSRCIPWGARKIITGISMTIKLLVKAESRMVQCLN